MDVQRPSQQPGPRVRDVTLWVRKYGMRNVAEFHVNVEIQVCIYAYIVDIELAIYCGYVVCQR